MQKALRQGDVLLVPRANKPDGERIPAKDGKIIVAEGETTGHHHSLPHSAVAAYMAATGQLSLDVTAPTELSHQEHSALPVEPGFYDVVMQRRSTAAPRSQSGGGSFSLIAD